MSVHDEKTFEGQWWYQFADTLDWIAIRITRMVAAQAQRAQL